MGVRFGSNECQIGPQIGQIWDLFKLHISTFCSPSQNVQNYDLKKSRICPFWVCLTHFGPKYGHRDVLYSKSGDRISWNLHYLSRKPVLCINKQIHYTRGSSGCIRFNNTWSIFVFLCVKPSVFACIWQFQLVTSLLDDPRAGANLLSRSIWHPFSCNLFFSLFSWLLSGGL